VAGSGDATRYGKHPKMPMSERAKIFQPFDPLKGYREMLRERELRMQQEVSAGDPADAAGGSDDVAVSDGPFDPDAPAGPKL
jgi:hypothetical protein